MMLSLKNKVILVTGGAGFIGSHLCDKYVNDGNVVLCLDNFMNGNLTNIKHLLNHRKFKLINGDIRDFDLLEKVVRDVDVVLHLAAQVHVDRSMIEPLMTYEINVLGTQNILEVARRYDIDRVVYASTSEVYGSAQSDLMSEDHPLDAPHPYGASKIAADRMCSAYVQTYGMDICIMRCFNVYGPRQRSVGYGGVTSLFTKRVLGNMPPVIYGNGEQTRDYTYIKDTVRAYDSVLGHDKPIVGPTNFGTGKEITINDLATKIIELCGKDLIPVHVEPRQNEVARLVADISKSRKLLDWKPEYSIDAGLNEFVAWYKNYGFVGWDRPV